MNRQNSYIVTQHEAHTVHRGKKKVKISLSRVFDLASALVSRMTTQRTDLCPRKGRNCIAGRSTVLASWCHLQKQKQHLHCRGTVLVVFLLADTANKLLTWLNLCLGRGEAWFLCHVNPSLVFLKNYKCVHLHRKNLRQESVIMGVLSVLSLWWMKLKQFSSGIVLHKDHPVFLHSSLPGCHGYIHTEMIHLIHFLSFFILHKQQAPKYLQLLFF